MAAGHPFLPVAALTSDWVSPESREFWRYYFAGQALAGLGEAVWKVPASYVADSCVLVADALLAELEREPKAEVG